MCRPGSNNSFEAYGEESRGSDKSADPFSRSSIPNGNLGPIMPFMNREPAYEATGAYSEAAATALAAE
jgi:hypothetical protein